MADIQKIMDDIKSLSVIDLNALVKAIEDEFGVSASAPVMATSGGEAQNQTEQKSNFDVVLKEIGTTKMAVIKAVKSITGVGLKEAKEIVESAPKEIKKDVPKEEADKIKEELEKAGATVELK